MYHIYTYAHKYIHKNMHASHIQTCMPKQTITHTYMLTVTFTNMNQTDTKLYFWSVLKNCFFMKKR